MCHFLGPIELSQLLRANYNNSRLIAPLFLSPDFNGYYFFLDSRERREIEDFGVLVPFSFESFLPSAVLIKGFFCKITVDVCFLKSTGEIDSPTLAGCYTSSSIFDLETWRLGLIKFLKVSFARFF